MQQENPIEARMSFSPAVWLVWRVASAIADRECTLIEPFYIVVATMLVAGLAGDSDQPETKAELDEVTRALELQRLYGSEVLRRQQVACLVPPEPLSLPAGKQPPSRSQSCKEDFENALKSAVDERATCAQLRHLIANIFRSCIEVHRLLGIDPVVAVAIGASLAAAAPAVQDQEMVEAIDVMLQPVDTGPALEAEIDWAVVGPKFAALSALTWEAGMIGSSGAFLQSLVEKMLLFISRATHGGV